MNRNTFLKSSLLAGAALISGLEKSTAAASKQAASPFRMKFSPDFNLFFAAAEKDPVDQIKWGYDNGFRAWESTGLKNRPVAEQERISQAIQKLGMEFGQFVGTMTFKEVTFAGNDKSLRDKVLADIRESVEIAKRMNTKFVHNVLGLEDPKLPRDFQMVNAIELLKRIADIYEPHGIVMVMETMNHKINHPGMFLYQTPQAYALSKAVNSPNVKMLCDLYHVQIEEGNILPTLDYVWDEVGYFQIGDTPGRTEPTTGEMNYVNILQHIADKGYKGFVGMEHKLKNRDAMGIQSALQAYRTVDPK